MTKTRRLMELTAVVYERGRFTADELAAEFGVSYRTMLRYLQELSGLGVPLYSEAGRSGGYGVLGRRSPGAAGTAGEPLLKKLFRPASFVVGLEMTAPFTAVSLSNVIVPELWAQWEMRSAEIARLVDPRTRVGAVRSRGPEYRYIAGAEVASLRVVPDGMAGIELPAKAYAVYRHDGAYRREDRDGTYFRALEKLRSNGMEHDPDAWGLEIFRSSGDGPPDGTECEIYIPLK